MEVLPHRIENPLHHSSLITWSSAPGGVSLVNILLSHQRLFQGAIVVLSCLHNICYCSCRRLKTTTTRDDCESCLITVEALTSAPISCYHILCWPYWEFSIYLHALFIESTRLNGDNVLMKELRMRFFFRFVIAPRKRYRASLTLLMDILCEMLQHVVLLLG